MTTIAPYIETLLQGDDLTFEQSGQLLDTVFEGDVPEPQIAAFLTAMRCKGVTAPELAGLASSLRNHAVTVNVDADVIDTCGTGGSRVKTCNVSTTSAIIAAGAGAHVAKHGNRGITSKCGSADVLAELGVKIDASPETIAKCIKDAGVGFMFAPMFHPAMKYVQPIRKALGFRTVFNFLGPLANPAFATAQVMGVADESLMEIVAEALKLLGIKYAMVVHSDGLDEISTFSETAIVELKDGQINKSTINAADFGIPTANIDQLKAADAASSAKIMTGILNGKETGPRKDIVVINAAAAIIAARLADDFASAIKLAEVSIADGKAADSLKKLIEISNS